MTDERHPFGLDDRTVTQALNDGYMALLEALYLAAARAPASDDWAAMRDSLERVNADMRRVYDVLGVETPQG